MGQTQISTQKGPYYAIAVVPTPYDYGMSTNEHAQVVIDGVAIPGLYSRQRRPIRDIPNTQALERSRCRHDLRAAHAAQ